VRHLSSLWGAEMSVRRNLLARASTSEMRPPARQGRPRTSKHDRLGLRGLVVEHRPEGAKKKAPGRRLGTALERLVLAECFHTCGCRCGCVVETCGQTRMFSGGRAQRWTRPPPPWAGTIGTTSPGGAQSCCSSRAEPPEPEAPGARRVLPILQQPQAR